MPSEKDIERNEDSDSEDDDYVPEYQSSDENDSIEENKVPIENKETEAEKDKIWQDFLSEKPEEKSKEPEKPKTVLVEKVLDFAGEKIKRPYSALSKSISALNNLLPGAKIQKMSTLDKSKLDWNKFVEKEDIEHELKSHNKGKDGYLEKNAFKSRTEQRQEQFIKTQGKAPSSNPTSRTRNA